MTSGIPGECVMMSCTSVECAMTAGNSGVSWRQVTLKSVPWCQVTLGSVSRRQVTLGSVPWCRVTLGSVSWRQVTLGSVSWRQVTLQSVMTSSNSGECVLTVDFIQKGCVFIFTISGWTLTIIVWSTIKALVLVYYTLHKWAVPPALSKTVSGHDLLLFWNGLSTIWHLKMKWVCFFP